MKKPFLGSTLSDTLEDKEIYSKLKKLNVDISVIKDLNLSHTESNVYFYVLYQLQKNHNQTKSWHVKGSCA